MANFEQKNGSGSLFKNEKKRPEQPDYTGSLKDLTGKSWRLAGWIKDGTKGKYLSLAMSEQTARPVPVVNGNDESDILPF